MRLGFVAPDPDLHDRLVRLLAALDGPLEVVALASDADAARPSSRSDRPLDAVVLGLCEGDLQQGRHRRERTGAPAGEDGRDGSMSWGGPGAMWRGHWPGVRLVAAVRAADLGHALPLLEHGCDAIAVIDGPMESALRSLRAALDGALWWPSTGLDVLRQQLRASPSSGRVSPREREVLRLLADGWTQGEIAGHFGLSTATVSTHVQRLYRKLDVATAPAAVLAGVRLGLVRP